MNSAHSYLPLFQLLSEIVEVEECRDDVHQSQPKKGPNSSLYGPSAEPRVKRPVRHSSKRRSLSLPTGMFILTKFHLFSI